MGLFEVLTIYLWNYFVFELSVSGLYLCWVIGFWGLFWTDDDGLLINECLRLWDGNKVTFPVDYEGLSDI